MTDLDELEKLCVALCEKWDRGSYTAISWAERMNDLHKNFKNKVSPRLVLALIAEIRELREALESVACLDRPELKSKNYWMTCTLDECAETMAKDTTLACEALKGKKR